MFDGGEWSAGYNHENEHPDELRNFVEDSASSADVRLYVSGNFANSKDERHYTERLASFLSGEVSEVEKQLALIRVTAEFPNIVLALADLRKIEHDAGKSKILSHLEAALVIQTCGLKAQVLLTKLETQ